MLAGAEADLEMPDTTYTDRPLVYLDRTDPSVKRPSREQTRGIFAPQHRAPRRTSKAEQPTPMSESAQDFTPQLAYTSLSAS